MGSSSTETSRADASLWKARLLAVVTAALVAGWPAAARTDDDAVSRARYDRYRQPERVIAALAIAPGQRVADVGAGTGYLTFRLVDAVGPKGLVVATDVDDGALAALRAHAPAPPNLVVRKVAGDDPGLEADRYDLVLLAFVDHLLRDRAQYLGKLRAALARGGRVAIVNRSVFRDALVEAAGRSGFAVVTEVKDLPGQFMVILAAGRDDATLPRKGSP